jgi:hypothetical protein
MRRLLALSVMVLFVAPAAVHAAGPHGGNGAVDNPLRDGKYLPRPVSPALVRAAHPVATTHSAAFDYTDVSLAGGLAVVAALGGVWIIRRRTESSRRATSLERTAS